MERKIETISFEDVRNLGKNQSISVGELMDFIKKEGVSRETKIAYERIEDCYFNKNDNGWKILEVTGLFEPLKDQYIVAQTIGIRNDDERGVLFISAHY